MCCLFQPDAPAERCGAPGRVLHVGVQLIRQSVHMLPRFQRQPALGAGTGCPHSSQWWVGCPWLFALFPRDGDRSERPMAATSSG